MSDLEIILYKLGQFTKRFYTLLLLKGLILFIAFGALLFLFVTGVEYFLWLGKTGRMALLFLFLIAEGILLYKWIILPLLFLTKARRGISHEEASLLIGKHFPAVNDKLKNLLELSKDSNKSDLLIASINQRAVALRPIPFVKAIDLNKAFPFFKYAVLPLVLLIVVLITGETKSFFDSYKRVQNFDIAYAPPAPFQFYLVNDKLSFLEDEAVVIKLQVKGKVVPENVDFVFNGRSFLMETNDDGFVYSFDDNVTSGYFYFEANGYRSIPHSLTVHSVPLIKDFIVDMVYPEYLHRKSETLNGTGNVFVPEGTQVTWRIKAEHTADVRFVEPDTSYYFNKANDDFVYTAQLLRTLDYTITTSNDNINDYETLGYRIDVVKDAFPTIAVSQVLDSLNLNTAYFTGNVSDDHLVKSIRLVYAPIQDPQSEKRINLLKPNAAISTFEYEFPTGLDLALGANYQLYFEVVDNDGLRNGKVSKSKVFTLNTYNDNELKNKELNTYKSVLDQFSDGIDKFSTQERKLSELNNEHKQKNELGFDDKAKLRQFLTSQERQEQLMEKFSQELKRGLEKEELNDKMKALLKERLERQEREARKNQKLLEELNKIADKIDKEELQQKLEELAKNQSNNKRSLEQLLELTKRYYVTEKANQLSQKLQKLSERQATLSKINMDEKFNAKEQKKLNDAYKKVDDELEDLKKDNSDLKKPLDFPLDKNLQEAVKQEQQEALDEIQKQQGDEESSDSPMPEENKNSVQQKMNSAAKKMSELSKALQQGASMSGGSTIAEDAEMLRQILDNLITFSFKQESLFDKTSIVDNSNSQFSSIIKKQQELKQLFQHVDDSLFALSLRRAELSEFINKQLTEVNYNVDKALEVIAENQLYQGASYQQYVLIASNSLADFLANALDNMQQSLMSGQGQGQGDDGQLPDIIKAQQNVQDKLGKMSGKGSQNKQGDGEPQEEQSQEGKEGSQGKEGKEGKEGDNAKQGDGGQEQGSNGQGGLSEKELQELYEIYKEQQQIRQQLEQQLKNIISNEQRNLAQKLTQQMEQFEEDLINNGVTERTLNKLSTIQHQLLKLDEAALQQGKKKERESKTNSTVFTAPQTVGQQQKITKKPSVEILNREALPLQKNHQKKVKGYFEGNNRI